jgi:hypothetical protein
MNRIVRAARAAFVFSIAVFAFGSLCLLAILWLFFPRPGR